MTPADDPRDDDVAPDAPSAEPTRDPLPDEPAPPAKRRGFLRRHWLGVLAPVKHVDRLLRAVAEVTGPRLVLVGDGPERPRLEALVAELGLADRVEFRGFVPEPAACFAGADLFALPSGAEACPLALLQAMSAGLPAVATRVGGIPDVVRDGVDGLLVRADDHRALVAALSDLASDPVRRDAMSRAARERIVAEYSLEGTVDRLLDVYAR